ncbi:MAG: SDR family NAD(P)-dependent oxidoreductase [Frankiales bacterium]|nr:MAG: SDR family NAD(P)-dependent oxidoreductase [Frankiales bacterium]
MRVAVTGGTGFLGAHSVAALVAAGHDVRLLARGSTDAVTALGVDEARLEVLRGDVTDPAAVDRLLVGADAVLHAAGVVGLDERDADRMTAVNVDATRLVLQGAVDRGLDPVVHVSSYSALFPCADPVMTPDSATVEGRSAYGRTKAAGDRIARALQADGAPVVITYPSTVLGPPAGDRRGLAAIGWDPLLRLGASITFDGGMVMVDVRDVAAVHVAVMTPGRGPRRYLCGGRMTGFDEVLDLLQEASGRRIRRVRIPKKALLGVGRASDLLSTVVPIAPLLSYEAAWLLTSPARTDDSRTHDELGVRWRPLEETIRAAVRT